MDRRATSGTSGGRILTDLAHPNLDRLADHLLSITREQGKPALLAYLRAMDPDDLETAERALGTRFALGWRANPAAMAEHLTNGEYQRWPYIELLASSWADAFQGVDPHQMWVLPSQYGKTSLCGWGITWALDLNPKLRFMYLSYDADKAVEEGGQWRDMIEAHQDALSFALRPDRRARGMWRTDQGGGLYSVGIKGGLAGWPADCLVGDDLIKGWQAAHSPTEREIAWRVWSGQGRLRLQAFTDPMFLVGTRTHEDDPQARQLKLAHDSPEAGGWKVIRLPAIAEEPDPTATDPMLREPDPLGRKPGEVIESRRFSAQEVNARRLTLGSYLFASMEQARPAPQEGGELKRAWWRQETNLPVTVDDALTSWDPKFKEEETGDYVVGGYMARTGSSVWVLDVIRGQWTQDGTACAIALMAVRHPLARRHVVENTGNGPEVMESLRSAVAGYVVPEETAVALGMTEAEREAVQAIRRRGMGNLIPNTPKGSKVVRARAYSGYLEAGSVKVPADAPWLGAFLDETAAFPGQSVHDDQVDMWSQGMSLLARTAASLQRPTGNVGKAAAPRPGPLPRGFSRR